MSGVKGLQPSCAYHFTIGTSLPLRASAVFQKVPLYSQTVSRTCSRERDQVSQPDVEHKVHLQPFFARSDGTVGNRKTHTTVSDGIEGLVTKNPGLHGDVR